MPAHLGPHPAAKQSPRHSGVVLAACRCQAFGVSTRFKSALILAASVAALNLVLYFTGAQTERLATGHYFMWLAQVFMVVVLWRGIRAVRAESRYQALTYGQGVGAGVMISLYAGLLSGAYAFIHFKYVNPRFADYQLVCLRPQWDAAGMSAGDVAKAEKLTRFATTPAAQAVLTPIVTVCFGLIISLVLAALLKRAATSRTSPPMRAN